MLLCTIIWKYSGKFNLNKIRKMNFLLRDCEEIAENHLV